MLETKCLLKWSNVFFISFILFYSFELETRLGDYKIMKIIKYPRDFQTLN